MTTRIIGGLVLVLACADVGRAQAGLTFRTGVNAGLVFPSGIAERHVGFTAGLDVDIETATPFGARLEGSFTNAGTTASGLNLANGSGRVNAVFAPHMPVLELLPYLIGGVGFYSFRTGGDEVSDGPADPLADYTETRIGWNVGAGFNIPVARVGTRIEIRYHVVPLGRALGSYSYVPLTFGLRF